MNDHIETKRQLLAACHQLINDKIENLNSVLDSIKRAKHNETKSSAGDKFETGRAMMHLEEEKNGAQLMQNVQLRQALGRIKLTKIHASVSFGSIVITPQAKYFISVGLGKVSLDGTIYFCLSPEAPIGKALWGKQAGERLLFNKREIEISAVF